MTRLKGKFSASVQNVHPAPTLAAETVNLHGLKSAYVLFSIFDLPFANSDELAGQRFHRNSKKKFNARSPAALDLTVCKKRCVQKTST